MANTSVKLMLTGVRAACADCGTQTVFVPVEDGCTFDGCEFCCTVCDAAVFLLPVLDNTGTPHRNVA